MSDLYATPCPHCERFYTDLPGHIAKPCGTPPSLTERAFQPTLTSERWAEIFWSRVREGARHECWEWTGAHSSGGHGVVKVPTALRKMLGAPRSGFMIAHRVAFALTHGQIPDGSMVRHRCDNHGCCNPEHLETGDHHDNMNDMVVRGRSRLGRARRSGSAS